MNRILQKTLNSIGRTVIKAMASSSDRGWSKVIGGSYGNSSKEQVNNQTALTVSSLYACVRNLSEDIAKLPLKIYQKDGDYRYERSEHPISELLQYQPNPEMTAMAFRETMTAQAMGWGNAYAEILRNTKGEPVQLWPLRPDRVRPHRTNDGRLFYRITTDGGNSVDVWAEDILHIHGLGSDGLQGYNIVEYASQSIGAAIAMDKFAGAYFGNGMHQSGNLKHPGTLTEPAQNRLRRQLEAEYVGSDKSHRILVLEEGMEFIPNTIDPKASQMVETRKFSVTEFCRWLRIPPHKVADLERATFSNIEEQNIDYVQDGLLGWCIRWEQALRWKLLSDAEKRSGYYLQHKVEGLLRGNLKARVDAYAVLWDRGILSINETRSKEDLNPIEGGDAHFVPLNFVKLEDAGKHQDNSEAVTRDIAQRLASREINAISKRIKHASEDPDRFKEWLGEFYDKHNVYVSEAIAPLCKDDGIESINIDMLTMNLFLQAASAPEQVFKDRKDKHADYIANNLRSYYEN